MCKYADVCVCVRVRTLACDDVTPTYYLPVGAPKARVRSRELKTGRGVPEKELVDSMLAPDKSLGKLVSKVDFIARIDNNHDVPRLASFEHVDNSGSWNLLKSRFARTCEKCEL